MALSGSGVTTYGNGVTAVPWFNAIHTSRPRFRLGSVKKDMQGNSYVYLAGVASNIAGAWVTYNAVSPSTTPVLVVSDSVGPLAISMSANTSSVSNQLATSTTVNWSWYMVQGNYATAQVLDNGPAPGAPLYVSATVGVLDDAAIAGEWVTGAVVTTQAVTAGSTGTAGVFINFPFIYDEAYLT